MLAACFRNLVKIANPSRVQSSSGYGARVYKVRSENHTGKGPIETLRETNACELLGFSICLPPSYTACLHYTPTPKYVVSILQPLDCTRIPVRSWHFVTLLHVGIVSSSTYCTTHSAHSSKTHAGRKQHQLRVL